MLVRAAVKNFFRNPTAERQRPQGASQIESGNKKLHALLCAARAASALQRRAMAALAVLGNRKGAILPLRMALFPYVPRALRRGEGRVAVCRATKGPCVPLI